MKLTKQEKINKLKLQIDILEQEIQKEKLLKQKLEYQTIEYAGKEFRIYIWENKPIKNLQVKGFQIAEFQDFVELIDNRQIELEVWKYYYVKHFSKLQQSKNLCLSGLYLDKYLALDAYKDNLSDSNGNGRVVLVRENKK